MTKNYTLFVLFLFFQGLQSQEIQYFMVQDFDLKGKVKSCTVNTGYGKEYFEFNKEGVLIKAVTEYNESDQDITYYRYKGGELVEKRMESYKDKRLDAATSLVSWYTIDSLPQRRVVEKISSYDKAFLEQQDYQFDAAGRLVKIITANDGGVDETTLEYTPHEYEPTLRIFTNGILKKSIQTTEKETPDGWFRHVLTQVYMEGTPYRAIEEVYDVTGKLVLKETFQYNTAETALEFEKKKHYYYTPEGLLEKVVTQTATSEWVDTYSFQYDAHPEKNWIKQIITPANTYTTRSIMYYPEEESR